MHAHYKLFFANYRVDIFLNPCVAMGIIKLGRIFLFKHTLILNTFFERFRIRFQKSAHSETVYLIFQQHVPTITENIRKTAEAHKIPLFPKKINIFRYVFKRFFHNTNTLQNNQILKKINQISKVFFVNLLYNKIITKSSERLRKI